MNKVHIEAVSRTRTMHRRDPEDESTIWTAAVDYGHVVGLRAPDGNYVTNKFTLPVVSRFRSPDVHDAVEIDDCRAARLTQLFANLRRGHFLQCHDLIEMVEGVDPLEQVNWTEVKSADDIESGRTYGVLFSRTMVPNSNWRLSHSCMGTDNQNLLGVNGSGGELMVTDFEATKRLFSYGSSHVVLASLDH